MTWKSCCSRLSESSSLVAALATFSSILLSWAPRFVASASEGFEIGLRARGALAMFGSFSMMAGLEAVRFGFEAALVLRVGWLSSPLAVAARFAAGLGGPGAPPEATKDGSGGTWGTVGIEGTRIAGGGPRLCATFVIGRELKPSDGGGGGIGGRRGGRLRSGLADRGRGG
jgi:hypothetical protein